MDPLLQAEDSHVDLLHEIGSRRGTAGPFHAVLDRLVEFASSLVRCDSCFIYVLEGEETGIARFEELPSRDSGSP